MSDATPPSQESAIGPQRGENTENREAPGRGRQQSGRGGGTGEGRGGGRSPSRSQGRGQPRLNRPQQRGGPPGRGPRPVGINQSSGIPFGHVPAYLPGSASLVEELDQRMLIVLRDGKHLIGTLASFDQFSNLVLLDAFERRIVTVKSEDSNPNQGMGMGNAGFKYFYADIPLGVYIVRGDSMVLAGEVQDNSAFMEEISLDKLQELKEQAEEDLEWDFDADLIA